MLETNNRTSPETSVRSGRGHSRRQPATGSRLENLWFSDKSVTGKPRTCGKIKPGVSCSVRYLAWKPFGPKFLPRGRVLSAAFVQDHFGGKPVVATADPTCCSVSRATAGNGTGGRRFFSATRTASVHFGNQIPTHSATAIFRLNDMQNEIRNHGRTARCKMSATERDIASEKIARKSSFILPGFNEANTLPATCQHPAK